MADPPPDSPACPGSAATPTRVLLLSLWGAPGKGWHARLVGPDAAVHEFDSPFELARFLTRPPLPERVIPPDGLR